MTLRGRLARLEARAAQHAASRPLTVYSGPALTLESLSGKSARELYDLALSVGVKVVPTGKTPGRGEGVNWEDMRAMSAPELARLYFADGAR